MKKIFKYVPSGGPKLDGINTGVVDLGSSSLKFKRINGKRIQSEAALSAKYEEATEAFIEEPNEHSWATVKSCILELVTPTGEALTGLKLGSMYQDHFTLIASIEKGLIISTEEAESQARFIQAGDAFRDFPHEEIPVLGGPRTYYSEHWPHPIGSLDDTDSINQLSRTIEAVIASTADEEDLGKSIATVLQGVLSDLYLERITAVLRCKHEYETFKLYATSGGSNPGYGIIFSGGHAYESVLDKIHVKNFHKDLAVAINSTWHHSKSLDAIMTIILDHLSLASEADAFCDPVSVPNPTRVRSSEGATAENHDIENQFWENPWLLLKGKDVFTGGASAQGIADHDDITSTASIEAHPVDEDDVVGRYEEEASRVSP